MFPDDQLSISFQQERRVWTVTGLVTALSAHVRREYSDIWLEGEISNLRSQPSGHQYFTLKDKSSQMSAVIFSSRARLLRFRLESGMQVVARGAVSIYEDRGQLQLIAQTIEPQGVGSLQVAFEQLKARLFEEGLFDASRKKPIPSLPRRIGIVTSPQAAALRDMLNILRRRHRSVPLLIYPAQVQGDSAAAEVSEGIRYFNRSSQVDVIIIARGGGSIEDLSAFNNEGLARVIAASQIPLISAVGHETDVTIADFVADLRAPTPSAAAEMVIDSHEAVFQRVEGLHAKLARALQYELLKKQRQMSELTRHGAFARIAEQLGRRHQRVDDLTHRLNAGERALLEKHRRRYERLAAVVLHYDARKRLVSIAQRLELFSSAMANAIKTSLMARRSSLGRLSGRIEALSPLGILERGYALVFDANGNLVKNAAQVSPGEEVSARLAHGSIRATVR